MEDYLSPEIHLSPLLMTGHQEVPALDTHVTGGAIIEFIEDRTVAEFQLGVLGGPRVTQAHIHCAPLDANGPVVAFLAGFHELGWNVNGRWIHNVILTDDNIIPTIPEDNPTCPHIIGNIESLFRAIHQGNTYVNVHTVDHPDGLIRGQLEEVEQD